MTARRDAFDEYCKERLREIRAEKLALEKGSTFSTLAGPGETGDNENKTEGEQQKKDSKAEFEHLLREEVTSTRTSWTEWRRTWKKDRRFWGWGRDDRERERRFRDWVKELGERMLIYNDCCSISLTFFSYVSL